LSNKRAVIFANGIIADFTRLNELLLPDDLLIAADGGLHHLVQLGQWPQVLIGDLDSAIPEEVDLARKNGTEVHKYPVNKDQTDLQLAIDFAVNAGCSLIMIAAGLGGRLDQTLGNLFLLTRSDLRTLDVRLDDGMEEVFFIRIAADIRGTPGDTVSLIAYCEPALGVKTENLLFPLQNETLYPDQTRGISNVMETNYAKVSLSKGIIICIHSRQILPVNK
jgi:thiamine pyrophosphokinase